MSVRNWKRLEERLKVVDHIFTHHHDEYKRFEEARKNFFHSMNMGCFE